MLIFLFVPTLFLIISAYWGIVFYIRLRVSRELVRSTKGFQNISDDHTKSLLVIGDSTGVGVGASRPEESIAGLLSSVMGATYTENVAVSGSVVADLAAQIERAQLEHYNMILVQIGANNI